MVLALSHRRGLYGMPSPPTPEALTAIRAVLQACVLLATSLMFTGSLWGDQAAPQQVVSISPVGPKTWVCHN